MCGDFCPIPGHYTDAKYNKLASDLSILNKFVFLGQIYFTYNIHTYSKQHLYKNHNCSFHSWARKVKTAFRLNICYATILVIFAFSNILAEIALSRPTRRYIKQPCHMSNFDHLCWTWQLFSGQFQNTDSSSYKDLKTAAKASWLKSFICALQGRSSNIF